MTAPTTTRAQGDKMKPYYDEDGITIYCGDCREVLPHLAASSVDATIADPPYGTTACAWDSVIPFDVMWRELKRLNKTTAPIVLFGVQPFTSTLVMSNPAWLKVELIWDKGRGFEPQLANIRPMRAHENITVFGAGAVRYNPQKTPIAAPDIRNYAGKSGNRKDGTGLNILASLLQDKTYTDRYPLSIMRFDPVPQSLKLHPSEKPIELLRYLILTYTNPGDLVLDFTMGSGTTLRAAKDLGRKAIGIEISERYCEIAAHRLSQNVLALEAL